MGRKRKLPIVQEVKDVVDYRKNLSEFNIQVFNNLDKAFEEMDDEFYSYLESNDPSKVKLALDIIRPKTYDDCLAVGWGTKENPCPFFSCKNNLFLDVNDDGEIKFIHKKKDFDQIPETCLNRAIENGPLDFKQISELIGVVRERARQIKNEAKEKIRNATEFKKMEGLIFVSDEEEYIKNNKNNKESIYENPSNQCDDYDENKNENIEDKLRDDSESEFDFILRDKNFSVEKTNKSDNNNHGTRKNGPTKNEWRKRRFYPSR